MERCGGDGDTCLGSRSAESALVINEVTDVTDGLPSHSENTFLSTITRKEISSCGDEKGPQSSVWDLKPRYL